MRWALGIGACALFGLGVAALLFDLSAERISEAMLTLARTIRVGETTVPEMQRVAGSLRVSMDARKQVEKDSIAIEKVPISGCLENDCVIYLGPSPLEKKGFVSDLQVWYPRSGKWLRSNTFYVAATTRKGVVQEIQVFVISIDGKTAYEAITIIRNDISTGPWTIRREEGWFEDRITTGLKEVKIHASPNASRQIRMRALDFDLGCLHLTKYCSECEILPFACQEYEHGDWYYFEISGDLLNNFQTAVNELRLGSLKATVLSRLGNGGPSGGELFKDRLPYLFPDSTMSDSADPNRLIYYVKKRRQGYEGDSKDRVITLAFDRNDRLVRIESQVDGIHSRP